MDCSWVSTVPSGLNYPFAGTESTLPASTRFSNAEASPGELSEPWERALLLLPVGERLVIGGGGKVRGHVLHSLPGGLPWCWLTQQKCSLTLLFPCPPSEEDNAVSVLGTHFHSMVLKEKKLIYAEKSSIADLLCPWP